jgi:hypothetical protein
MHFITNNLSRELAGARAECWYGKDFEGNFATQRAPPFPSMILCRDATRMG